jgi:glucan phosphoethanolaminetransferase (alkaline phosphatase superfamily)
MKYIEGITLLETIQEQAPIWRILGIVFGVIFAIVTIWIGIQDKAWIPTIGILFLNILMIVVCIVQLIEGPYNQYKVRIDDYSALPAIVEEYDIVKSERDIWYLEEKEK